VIDVIQVTPSIGIDESELQFVFSRSSGPGGQNVNKVSTAVQLRFDVNGSAALPARVRKRLAELAGSRMTRDGVLVINARRRRTQERNRQDAIDRLVELIREAARRPKRRIDTKPTVRSRERRLEEKKHRSRIKQKRGRVTDDGQ
jgi:ribosome-associated protein